MKKLIFKLAWVGVFLIAIIIFLVSSISFPKGTPGPSSNLGTLYHFLIFFWLAFFLQFALGKCDKKLKYFIFIAIVITSMYSVLDEFHQLFVIGRCCDFNDFLVDFCGILTASFVYTLSLFSLKDNLPSNLMF